VGEELLGERPEAASAPTLLKSCALSQFAAGSQLQPASCKEAH
jgi:hypothetical protein